MAQRQSALRRMCSSLTFRVDKFCCGCSLRAGVLVVTLLNALSAILAFASIAAIYNGFLSALLSQSESAKGVVVKIDDPKVHGLLIGVGLYKLALATLGFFAVFRKHYRSALLIYYATYIEFVLAVILIFITWFMGASFGSILGQIPTMLINFYLLVVVNSYRHALRPTSFEELGDLPPPSDDSRPVHGFKENEDLSVTEADIALTIHESVPPRRETAFSGSRHLEEEEEDIDLGGSGSLRKNGTI